MSEKIVRLERGVIGVIDMIYPVGSIYISANSTSPAELFGGTWEQIKDRFLLAAGDTYTAGSTGGEAAHTLTINEMPWHNHELLKGGASDHGDGRTQAIPDKHLSYADEKLDNKYYWQAYTSFAGGSQPHNNMPPYISVYMWKRTA